LLARDLEKGGIDAPIGTIAECAAEMYRDGVLGQLAGIVGTAASLYILNHVAGHWVYSPLRGYYFQPSRLLPYPIRQTMTCTATVTHYVEETVLGPVRTTSCDGAAYPQPCLHYSSVIRERQGLETIVCPVKNLAGSPAVTQYNRQHKTAWNYWVSNKPNNVGGVNKCNRDEYPPHAFLAGANDYPNGAVHPPAPTNYDQWIRFVPESENKGAGKYWRGLCDNPKKKSTSENGPINDETCTKIWSVTHTVSALKFGFTNMPAVGGDDGLFTNWCQLVSTMRDDPGFALLSQDPWFGGFGRAYASHRDDYRANVVPATLTNGKSRPRNAPAKRWKPLLPELYVDDGNSTTIVAEPDEHDVAELFRLIAEEAALYAAHEESPSLPVSTTSLEECSSSDTRWMTRKTAFPRNRSVGASALATPKP